MVVMQAVIRFPYIVELESFQEFRVQEAVGSLPSDCLIALFNENCGDYKIYKRENSVVDWLNYVQCNELWLTGVPKEEIMKMLTKENVAES